MARSSTGGKASPEKKTKNGSTSRRVSKAEEEESKEEESVEFGAIPSRRSHTASGRALSAIEQAIHANLDPVRSRQS